MPVFHFNIRRGSAVYDDHEGFFATNLAEAVLHAEEDARAIMREEPEVPAQQQWVEITDPNGNVLRTVPFVTVN
ncbi:MAG: DUF6894 family protein [Devosia sp.]|jgi:hypothetical protein